MLMLESVRTSQAGPHGESPHHRVKSNVFVVEFQDNRDLQGQGKWFEHPFNVLLCPWHRGRN